jgi:ribosomal protein L35AE/L33A
LQTIAHGAHDARAVEAHAANPRAPAQRASRTFSGTFILIVAAGAAAAAWAAGRFQLYTPGSDFGYHLGLAGSLMMLLLLAYPLRKRVAFLRRAGELRIWFRLHMFLGIAGPVLVMFHSTLQARSLNAAIALYSMLLVAGSGIVGRFIYTKIHNGLYGRQASLQERVERLGGAAGAVRARLRFSEDIGRRLADFEAYAAGASRPGMIGARRFLAVAWRARWLRRRTLREIHGVLRSAARERRWTREDVRARLRIAQRMLDDYLEALKDVAQFQVYERLFSLWHVLHVPFVYMLLICAIVHVVAVHMY